MFKWLLNVFDFYRLGFGGSGSAQTSKYEPLDELRDYHGQVVEQASQLANDPYNPYPFARVADLNPTQMQGLQWTADLAASSSPEVNAARNVSLNTLTGAYQNPYAQMQTQVGYNPTAGTSVSGSVGSNPYANAALSGNVERNPYIPLDNPYLRGAIQSGQRDLADAYRYATAPQTDSAFALQHGFGGTAYDQAVNRNQDQLLKAMSGVEQQYGLPAYQQSSQLYENLINRDVGVAQSDLERMAGLNESAINRDVSTMQSDLNRIGGLYESAIDRGLSAQQADINRGLTSWEAERNRQMSQIPQAFQSYQNELGQAQALVGVGDVFQQQEQTLLNDLAAEWQRAQTYPQAQLDSFLNTLIRASGGFGTNTTNTTQASSVNPASAILGSALAGYGLFGS